MIARLLALFRRPPPSGPWHYPYGPYALRSQLSSCPCLKCKS